MDVFDESAKPLKNLMITDASIVLLFIVFSDIGFADVISCNFLISYFYNILQLYVKIRQTVDKKGSVFMF